MKPKKILFQPWLLILIFGILLFFFTRQAYILTGENPNYLPTLIVLGSFLVPVVLVAYFYDNVKHREISTPLLSACFFVGGVLGSIAAGVLESRALNSLDIVGVFGIGAIEEGAKLIFPVAMYIGWRYRHEADGLLFGVAAGMGFAALETMGYALVTLVETFGDFSALQQVLLERGLLSPAGHAAWTGFFCAVLWREREKKGHMAINRTVIGAFLLTVMLHTLWNIFSSLEGPSTFYQLISLTGGATIVMVSLTMVTRRYAEAKRALNNGGAKLR